MAQPGYPQTAMDPSGAGYHAAGGQFSAPTGYPSQPSGPPAAGPFGPPPGPPAAGPFGPPPGPPAAGPFGPPPGPPAAGPFGPPPGGQFGPPPGGQFGAPPGGQFGPPPGGQFGAPPGYSPQPSGPSASGYGSPYGTPGVPSGAEAGGYPGYAPPGPQGAATGTTDQLAAAKAELARLQASPDSSGPSGGPAGYPPYGAAQPCGPPGGPGGFPPGAPQPYGPPGGPGGLSPPGASAGTTDQLAAAKAELARLQAQQAAPGAYPVPGAAFSPYGPPGGYPGSTPPPAGYAPSGFPPGIPQPYGPPGGPGGHSHSGASAGTTDQLAAAKAELARLQAQPAAPGGPGPSGAPMYPPYGATPAPAGVSYPGGYPGGPPTGYPPYGGAPGLGYQPPYGHPGSPGVPPYPPGPVLSSTASQLEKAKMELAALQRGTAHPPPPQAYPVSSSPGGQTATKLAELQKELQRLQGPSVSRASESQSGIQALEEQLRLLQMAGSATGAASTPDPAIAKLQEQLKDARQAAQDSQRRQQSALQEAERLRQQAATSSHQAQDLQHRLTRISKGLDLCIFMDITGSMTRWIGQCKEKVREIYEAIVEIDPTYNLTRMAFVGYRDFQEATRFEIVDFVDQSQQRELQSFIANVDERSINNNDFPEDVTAGLKRVRDLSWQSTTRVLIHVGDAPCHGKRYHGHDLYDARPDGDPEDNPEDLVRQLAEKRIDYYFMRITEYTDKMTSIFQAEYRQFRGRRFEIIPVGGDASQFLPSVIASVSKSMQA